MRRRSAGERRSCGTVGSPREVIVIRSASTFGRLSAGAFLLISAALLAWGYWPADRLVRILSVSSDLAAAGSAPARWQTTVTSPVRIRLGDSDLLQLTIAPESAARGADLELAGPYLTHARLDLPGVDVQPAGLISEPMPVGGAASYFWSVRASHVGKYSGTVWLYVSPAPSGFGDSARVPMAAQPVRLEVLSFFGLAGAAARTLGTIGGLISLPFFIRFASNRFRGATAGGEPGS